MSTATETLSHVPIQKRHHFACRFCRVPMEPGSKEAAKECPKRAGREEIDHASRGLDLLKTTAVKMKSDLLTAARRARRDKGTKSRK